MVVPVIINQGGDSSMGNTKSNFEGGSSMNPDVLRDMIQQAVSTQMQLHQMKSSTGQSFNRQSVDTQKTTQSMRDEEAKLRCEQ